MIRELFAFLKEVILDYVKHRLFPITVLFLVLFAILVRRLFVLQIVEGQEHMDNFIYKSEKTLTVDAVRGNIYDRNGNLLAYNELSYTVVYSNDPNISNYAKERGVSENELKNQVIYDTLMILEENGDEITTDFPIELTDDGKFKFKVSEARLNTFLKDVYAVTSFDDLSDERKNSTAEQVMDYLSNDLFEVSSNYSDSYRLQIVSIRYKLWLNRYQQYVPVNIAYDISEKSNAAITENCDRLPGMSVSVKSLRRYNDAKYYAHIIGYIGGISDEELKKYNEELPVEQQYSAGEMVGKTGIEQYCESELRGESGYETMYVDNLGKMIETVDSKQATAGNDVYLTIDADLQKYCYDTLEKEIASIILANLANVASVPTDENSAIPITDVYFGLFDNNYLKIDSMGDSDATELEKQIYNKFVNKKETTLNKIEDILKIDHTPLYNLNTEYQNHMEYICEILSKNGIYNRSLVSSTSDEFVKYTSNQSSLEEYLKYCISIEAIDISAFEADSNYYDTDEIYDLLCDYIVNYLSLDTEFDKRLIENMIYSSEITGYDVVNLIYDQGILNPEGDEEYDNFKNGVYGPYEFMQHKIKNLEITPAMLALDPCSGAVIVTDVNSGDVLAMVSYPGYDNNYLTNEVDADYYEMLLNDKTSPMYSKATQQQTAPGSTFKLMSSIVGLSEGVVDQSTRTYCSGLYDEIYPPAQCWIYPGGHGYLEIEEALQRSCNVYFYNIGYNLSIMPDGSFSSNYGLSRIQKYATLFGLNDLSGVELPEVPPHISDDDSIRTCIGQGTNSYAPVQLARYVTTIANSGTCYNLTLIDKITDYSGNVIRDNSASVLYNVDLPESTWNSVHNGMRRATSYLSSTYLINNINVAVAGKTGTAQEDRTRYNHALYVSYAPFEEPEVSVTCVIQHGYSSGNPRELASFIYAYMYDPEALVGAEMKGNIMVSD